MIIAHYTACDWLRDYEMDFGDDFDAFLSCTWVMEHPNERGWFP